MTRWAVVLDANAVIGFVKGQVFDLLPQLFPAVSVPQAVVHEVIHRGPGRPGAQELAQALGTWTNAVTPDPVQASQFAAPLSPADREVLAVALGGAGSAILSDDRALRREAHRHHLRCIGTAEVVVLMKEYHLIPAVKPVLDTLRQTGFGISEAAYKQALQAVRE